MTAGRAGVTPITFAMPLKSSGTRSRLAISHDQAQSTVARRPLILNPRAETVPRDIHPDPTSIRHPRRTCLLAHLGGEYLGLEAREQEDVESHPALVDRLPASFTSHIGAAISSPRSYIRSSTALTGSLAYQVSPIATRISQLGIHRWDSSESVDDRLADRLGRDEVDVHRATPSSLSVQHQSSLTSTHSPSRSIISGQSSADEFSSMSALRAPEWCDRMWTLDRALRTARTDRSREGPRVEAVISSLLSRN